MPSLNNCTVLIEKLDRGAFDASLKLLYPRNGIKPARKRLEQALHSFMTLYGDGPAVLISAPGRTEVCGNHTDHQQGRVLAAAVDLDILCVASPNRENVVRIKSEGFQPDTVELSSLTPRSDESSDSAALIRGVAAWFADKGYPIGGFNAYMTSQVLRGSGLSSSAAFEIALGNIFKTLYGGAEISAAQLAIAGQFAENKYMLKPSGLMDQMACSLGGMNMIDFANPSMPVITPAPCDLSAKGYSLCIVDTGGNHADLTPEYAAIPSEMSRISSYFNKENLHQVNEESFRAAIGKLRKVAGDRAVLRAIHYFTDDARVPLQAAALKTGNIAEFLTLIRQSGLSSVSCLQNVFVPGESREQGLTLALAISNEILGDAGACRVHGGGFAGTIQAFVPMELVNEYSSRLNDVFGAGACHILSIRPVGGIHIQED